MVSHCASQERDIETSMVGLGLMEFNASATDRDKTRQDKYVYNTSRTSHGDKTHVLFEDNVWDNP